MTGIDRLDPLVALLVGVNIIVTGWRLMHQSFARPHGRGAPRRGVGARSRTSSPGSPTTRCSFHGLRTRSSGHRGFAEVHVLVPGEWSVQHSHDLVERIESALDERVSSVSLIAHVEPREDPRSYDDYPTEVPVLPLPDPATPTSGQ